MMLDENTTPVPQWYVVHTYAGYENKVRSDLERAVERLGMGDLVLEAQIPTEEIIEIRDNKKRAVRRNVYPGYVMVKMVMTNESWYLVRNTRGVTGFVGSGNKPVPLTDKEVRAMGVENVHIKIDIQVGENVRVLSGPLENFVGVVQEIHPDRQKMRVMVSMFGRETPVDLDFAQVARI
nr:transcription termination/antitermination protein NusG [bacterium]